MYRYCLPSPPRHGRGQRYIMLHDMIGWAVEDPHDTYRTVVADKSKAWAKSRLAKGQGYIDR